MGFLQRLYSGVKKGIGKIGSGISKGVGFVADKIAPIASKVGGFVKDLNIPVVSGLGGMVQKGADFIGKHAGNVIDIADKVSGMSGKDVKGMFEAGKDIYKSGKSVAGAIKEDLGKLVEKKKS